MIMIDGSDATRHPRQLLTRMHQPAVPSCIDLRLWLETLWRDDGLKRVSEEYDDYLPVAGQAKKTCWVCASSVTDTRTLSLS